MSLATPASDIELLEVAIASPDLDLDHQESSITIDPDNEEEERGAYNLLLSARETSKDSGRNNNSTSRNSNTIIYDNEQDQDRTVNELILRANAPPPTNVDYATILQNIQARSYVQRQFGRIQDRAEMNPLTLRFKPEYEAQYRYYIQQHSTKRSRYCFILGLVSLLVHSLYEIESSNRWTNVLAFGLTLPILVLGILSTFLRSMVQHMERMTFVVFFIAGVYLILRKPLQETKGPILPLFILFIPIFGITRMRLTKNISLALLLFVTYLIVQLVFKTDDTSAVLFQCINYLISILGGTVSNFRQEMLRRRNFCLGLPFGGLEQEIKFQSDKFAKRKLLERYSRSFKDREVEETFYRYWYLIDPFPYEHPNAGTLHQGAFRTIRFAILALVLNQGVLGIQDNKFLNNKDQKNSHHLIALVLRYAVVVPAYVSAGLVMYFLGQSFYERWKSEESTPKRESSRRSSERSSSASGSLGQEHVPPPSPPAFSSPMKKNTSKASIYDLIDKGGYVKIAQLYAALVVSVHVSAMGALLLVISSTEKPQTVYYMGFLNAILFAHRSGFRVRFIYATHATVTVSLGFLAAVYQTQPDRFGEYLTYISLVLILGMLISYEEETLRRMFFVLKSVRVLEFDSWFTTVLKVQSWVRQKLKNRVEQARGRLEGLTEDEIQSKLTAAAAANATAAAGAGKMAQASKVGVWTQAMNVAIGAVAELS